MKTIKLHKEVIPPGPYCYSKIKVLDGGYRIKLLDLCPYWGRTDHGTVRCEYLKLESIPADCTDEEYEGLIKHFGSEEELHKQVPLFLLWDMVKECGINDEDEDYPVE